MRIPKPWLRSSNQTYYVCINGRQRSLGKDKKQAYAKYAELMHLGDPGQATVRQVLDAYWNWAKKNLADSTAKRRKGVLRSFGKAVPASLKVSQLKAHHVQAWIDSQPRVQSPTTASDYIALVKGVMNWAIGMGYLRANPIARMPKPSPVMRQDFLPSDLWPRILALATDQPFRDFLTVMLDSGARAEEMFKFGAQHFDGRRFVLPILDSKGRRKSRVVNLPQESLGIVERLVVDHPEGLLFRNSKGVPWNRNSVRCRLRRIRRILKLPRLTATMMRHSFAHHRLTQGQDALTVSKLMGHADMRMISQRYGHLEANSDYMHEAANQISFPSAPPDIAPGPKA